MSLRISSGLLLTTALISPAALAQPNYPATVDVFGGVNADGPEAGLELMAPFVEGEGSLLFGLARGTMGDETGAGGLGLGYRSQILPGWILGGYGMVDYQRGRSDEGYFQGVLGLEALTESFDLRVNGYLPEDDETAVADIGGGAPPPPPPVTVGDIFIIDHEIGLVTGVTAGTAGFFRSFEQPLPGIDAEIGYRLPVPGHDFRIFLGAFHFEGGDDYENVTGPKARAEWRIHDLDLFGNNSRLTLEAGIRDDDVRGTDASAGLRIRIPFGGVPSNQRGHELAGLDQRMLDPIRREDHIVTGEREEAQAGTPSTVEIEAVKAVETGNEITSIWFADGAGGGDGTMGNETDLATAVSDPGAGDQQGRLIVALGGSGNLAGNVTLADDQILLGGASTLQVMGLTSGTMATYAPGGARPTIMDASAGTVPVVNLGNGTFVVGVNATGNDDGDLNLLDDSVFVADTVSDIILRDISVTGGGAGGTFFDSSNIALDQFRTLGSDAGVVAVGVTNLSLADVTLDGNSGVGRLGLYLEDSTNVQTAASSGTPLTIMGVSLNGATLVDSSNVDIDGFSITQTNIYGILIGGGSGIAFRNGVIAEVNTSSTVAAGGAITVTSNLLGAGGSVDATFEDIMISGVHGVGVPGNRVAIFLSDVGGTLTTTFNRITIDAMDSGGTVVTDVGFGWSVGGTTNISGTGNVTNTAAECVQAVSVGGTLNGTVEINGAPHPTSPLAC